MILKVPTSKVAAVGMRKLAETDTVEKALTTLSGRARVKRTMWSRRAQEYEAKINSGDLVTIAEVVRDLYRSETQPEQSYSERQLYEAALDRMSREISAVRKLIDSESAESDRELSRQGAASRRQERARRRRRGGRRRARRLIRSALHQKSWSSAWSKPSPFWRRLYFRPLSRALGKPDVGDTPNLIFLPRWRLRLRRLRRHRFRPKWTAAPLRLPYERPANPMASMAWRRPFWRDASTSTQPPALRHYTAGTRPSWGRRIALPRAPKDRTSRRRRRPGSRKIACRICSTAWRRPLFASIPGLANPGR